jgi:MFS family permease
LLSQLGVGFILFYAPIFFVEQVGLTATQVGIGIGSQSVSGIVGRILGGSWADSPRIGRRKVLLLSAAISAAADGVLMLSYNFPVFLIGNLLMGMGIGLYWPATEAVVADLTTAETRNEAYAVVRLSDNLGIGIGVVLGGAVISFTNLYRLLFVADGITYLIFFGIIYTSITETLHPDDEAPSFSSGWMTALRDRVLIVYSLVNVMFTTYIAQIQSTLPLYLSQYVDAGGGESGLSNLKITLLFTWHVILLVGLQIPVIRYLARFSHTQALTFSALCWGLSFAITGLAGIASMAAIAAAAVALGIMALATVSYTPSSSSLVVDLAPDNLRGVYFSVNSLCWAVGYAIGPPIGGWSIDQGEPFIHQFWLIAAASVAIAIAILLYLNHLLHHHTQPDPDG